MVWLWRHAGKKKEREERSKRKKGSTGSCWRLREGRQRNEAPPRIFTSLDYKRDRVGLGSRRGIRVGKGTSAGSAWRREGG